MVNVPGLGQAVQGAGTQGSIGDTSSREGLTEGEIRDGLDRRVYDIRSQANQRIDQQNTQKGQRGFMANFGSGGGGGG